MANPSHNVEYTLKNYHVCKTLLTIQAYILSTCFCCHNRACIVLLHAYITTYITTCSNQMSSFFLLIFDFLIFFCIKREQYLNKLFNYNTKSKDFTKQFTTKGFQYSSKNKKQPKSWKLEQLTLSCYFAPLAICQRVANMKTVFTISFL